MNKIKAFTDAERSQYENLYVDIIMNTDEISQFLSDEDLRMRYVTKKAPILKEYLDKLDDADRKAEGNGLLEFLKSDDQYKEEVIAFKNEHLDELTKLTLCHKCKCLTCSKPCKFKSCQFCSYSNYVYNCDTERYSITRGHHNISLYSDDEERDVYFNVVGILKDDFSNKQYIYLVEATNKDNQHILEYCKYVNGNVEFLPLDETLLDKIYNLFVALDCYE
ncbi:MAG: hypothetical protein AB9856_17495 [Cellulosilyticaceae bacterium]